MLRLINAGNVLPTTYIVHPLREQWRSEEKEEKYATTL